MTSCSFCVILERYIVESLWKVEDRSVKISNADISLLVLYGSICWLEITRMREDETIQCARTRANRAWLGDEIRSRTAEPLRHRRLARKLHFAVSLSCSLKRDTTFTVATPTTCFASRDVYFSCSVRHFLCPKDIPRARRSRSNKKVTRLKVSQTETNSCSQFRNESRYRRCCH